MAKFFTSDWHVGEQATPDTHSFLRSKPTEVLAEEWLEQCHKLLKSDDIFYILGDLAVSLDDLSFYARLPKCETIIIFGDKEANDKNFSLNDWRNKMAEGWGYEGNKNGWHCGSIWEVEVGEHSFCVAHKPEDCMEAALTKPALCGHVHGIWRTQCMPNGKPIINVGVDAWGGIVSEEMISHQYDAITKGHYDKNARVDLWK